MMEVSIVAHTAGSNVELALKEIIGATIAKAFPSLSKIEPLITLGKVSEFQCNNAMGLSKALSQQKPPLKLSPQAVGEQLKQSLVANDLIENFEPTSKGFINLTIRSEWVSGTVHSILQAGIQPPALPHKRVLVDFSAPNIAKEMHVGHLRSTIIGECISRLLEFVQYDVKRINHLGDWGTSFGMLILYIKRHFPDFLTNPPDISDLTDFYRRAKQCFDEDPEFKECARLEVPKLQAYEPSSIEAWKFICDVSRCYFNSIYDRLGVHIEERGESFYNNIIPKVLQLIRDAGLMEENDGAQLVISKERKSIRALDTKDMTKLAMQHLAKPTRAGVVFHANFLEVMRRANVLSGDCGMETVTLSKKETKPWSKFDLTTDLSKLMSNLSSLYGKNGMDPLLLEVFTAAGVVQEDDQTIAVPRFAFPLMAVKSDGGYNYDTTDLACAYHRLVVEKMDRVIYCTDVGQFEHFKMVMQTARDMEWFGEGATWDHVGFGLVTGADGKKMKTRSGETVRLKDLMDDACEHSKAILLDREAGDRAQGHGAEDIERLSQIIGIGAIKYYDLKQSRTTDYVFNIDSMLDLSGNTAVFLLYQYARILSIKRKAGVSDEEIVRYSDITLTTPQEKKLALCALRFQAVIIKTVEDLFPHHLTDFAYELVTSFSEFFQHCKVIDDPHQSSRLCLVELTRLTLKKTLDLLNIETAERL